MTTSTEESTIPGYIAGTWTIDSTPSEVGFSARHMMVSKVRGKFTEFAGDIITGANPSATPAHMVGVDYVHLKEVTAKSEKKDTP